MAVGAHCLTACAACRTFRGAFATQRAISLDIPLRLPEIFRPPPLSGATTEAPGGRMEAPSAAPPQHQEVPTKSVAYTTKIHLSAAVSFVDFGGRSVTPESETLNPESESRKPQISTRNPKPETRNTESETRNPKPEIRNPKSETRNPKPGRMGGRPTRFLRQHLKLSRS